MRGIIIILLLVVVAFSSSFQIKNLRAHRYQSSLVVKRSLPSSSIQLTSISTHVLRQHRSYSSALQMEIMDLGDDSDDDFVEPETHGYEGDFQVGDIVKVNIHTKLYHVIKYRTDGFDPYGFIGTVSELALFGRKKKTLCSAITPVKVTFNPDGGRGSYPEDMFAKKFVAHFAGEELELVERP